MGSKTGRELLQECFNSDNAFQKFSQEFKYTKTGMLIEDIILGLNIPGRYLSSKEDLSSEIVRNAFHLSVAFLRSTEQDEILQETEENLEIAFGRKGALGVLAAGIGSLLACLFMDITIDFSKLVRQSLNAAWTQSNQEFVAEQWKYVAKSLNRAGIRVSI